MKIAALNCPNCGAGVADNSNHCEHCRSRLKTMSCAACFGTIFKGSKFCGLCGEKARKAKILSEKDLGVCPRCKTKMQLVLVDSISFSECEGCDGVWIDVETFQNICSDNEKQAAVLGKLDDIIGYVKPPKIQYVPCPTCSEFMNRNNFARSSGVIVDTCKNHGIWFDAEELPRIIEFIRQGGLDYARQKEKARLEAEKSRFRQEKFTYAVDRYKNERVSSSATSPAFAIREFIEFLID